MTTLLIGFVIAVGVLGTLVPILPGVALIWVAALVYGLAQGFGAVGWVAMTLITALAIGGVAAGIVMPQRAALAGGIGVRGQLIAVGLAAVGFFVIPVVGIAVGFVVGVYLVARRRHPERAWQVTTSTVRAMVLAAGVQFAAGVLMALVWLGWVVVT